MLCTDPLSGNSFKLTDKEIDYLELYGGLKLDDAVYDFEQQAKRIKR